MRCMDVGRLFRDFKFSRWGVAGQSRQRCRCTGFLNGASLMLKALMVVTKKACMTLECRESRHGSMMVAYPKI